MLDVAAVRRRFPALSEPGLDGRRVVHADAPGGTQAVDRAIDAMADHLRTGTTNAHGRFAASEAIGRLVADVRERVAGLFGGDADGVVFGPNMTTLTFHLAHALDEVVAGGEIVCTRLDHDANVAPWLQLAERAGAQVRWVELDAPSGTLAVESLDDVVTDRTRLVAFPRASNALGTLVDPGPFVAAARAVGAITFMDAVHAAPHLPLDRRAEGVDVLACSPYKWFGPHSGLLVADPDLLARLQPEKVRASADVDPDRWQTGTPSFEAIAGIGGAVDHLRDVGWEDITAHETALTQRFLDGLAGLDAVTLFGPTDPGQRTPTFALRVAGLRPAEVASRLAAEAIHVWDGHYYALEPMRALGLLDDGGAVRIGFVHYHDVEDVDRVLDALGRLAA